MDIPVIKIKQGIEKRVQSGHLWIFSNELEKVISCSPGTIVEIRDFKNKFIGKGYYNPHSLISIRLLSRQNNIDIEPDLIRNRIINADKKRKLYYPMEDSYRLVYSEGDYLPGLIIDKYADHLVLQILTAGMERFKDIICQILIDYYQPKCIYERSDSIYRENEMLPVITKVQYGILNSNLIIQQDGLKFHVELQSGQKTGFFFDQRDNRRSMFDIMKGKTVLDLFSGTGAWGVYAAKYGAREIVFIDSSQSALELAKQNMNLNYPHIPCRFISMDIVKDWMNLLEYSGYFDVIICDPPAFAKSKKHIPTAIKGYQKINQLAFKLNKPDGIIITSSCSYHISREIFRDIICKTASINSQSSKLLRYGTQSLDHPIILQIPETEYLKCITLKCG